MKHFLTSARAFNSCKISHLSWLMTRCPSTRSRRFHRLKPIDPASDTINKCLSDDHVRPTRGTEPRVEREEAQDVNTSHSESPWCIVNFYHLCEVSDPQTLVEEHRKWVEEVRTICQAPYMYTVDSPISMDLQARLDIKGRIYYSRQGVNAQFGGPRDHCLAYTEMVRAMAGFQALRYSVWPANGPMFPKLRLKYKPNLISLA